MIKDNQIRVDTRFRRELEDIKVQRIKRGFDSKLKSDRRLTAAMRRHPLFNRIKEDIIRDELKSLKDLE